MYRLTAGVLVALSLLSPLPSFAQMLPGSDPLTVTMLPRYPRPNSTVSIAPRSTLVDLVGSAVTVSVDGATVYTGSGTQATNVRVGGIGERTTVVVRVTDPSGRVYTETVVIRPAEVSLVMEPTTTAHPFYLGNTLVASEGRVRLIALPDLRSTPGTRLAPENLIYTWRLGDRILQDQSGIGRSTLIAEAPVRHRNAAVSVTVTNADNSLVGEASVLVAATDPIVRIYQNDPLLGPNFDVALANRFSMPDTEATFRAVGYFFAAPPTFSWTVGGRSSGSDKDITVRATGTGRGTASIGLEARENEHYQSADTRVSVEFGAGQSGLGIFGL